MRVLALTRYSKRAASTRQRFTQYFPALAEARVDVTLSPLLDDEHVSGIGAGARTKLPVGAYLRRAREILLHAPRYDALWVQYEAFPYLPGPFERLLRISGRPYVVDYDDAIFHNYDQAGGLRRALLGNKLAPLLRGAAACVAGNRYLAWYMQQYCRRTVVVPTVVDTDRYRPLPQRKPGPLRVGWIGSPSTWRYVEPLLPALLPVLQRFGAALHVVGAGPGANTRDVPGRPPPDMVHFIDWSENSEINLVQRFDIGIMPVPDEPWAHGKCGYKLIQYMGCGIASIASPIGVNAEIVSPGRDGLLATTADEWADALAMLLDDPALRADMGSLGRRKVVEHYSLLSQLGPMQEVFSRLRSA